MNQINTVYLVHHSHTDLGYTHDPPVVWELQRRFIQEALDLTEKYTDSASDGAFRWTVETTAPLKYWLDRAPDRDIERFIAMERAGRIEVMAMFANLTPLFDTDQLIESFQLLRTLRTDYGFTIRYAMNCDVNGHNWPLVDLLIDLGIEGFTMAINPHFGGAVTPRPSIFKWAGPSGRQIKVFNGWPYDQGYNLGIGRDAGALESDWWPRVEAYLASIDYPLPIIMVQSFHPFGDNGSAYEAFTPFIDEWNAAGKSPRIVLATPSMWWAAVQEYSHMLPVQRGDWTDYWNFGSISSAREQATNRTSRARLRTADALFAGVRALSKNRSTGNKQWAQQAFDLYREEAWRSLHIWDEHTWGADCSINAPDSEDTASQWYHKAQYAYVARSLSLLLQRDALADFAQNVERDDAEVILVFNPLPWTRQITGIVSQMTLSPRGGAADTTAGRHFQDRYGLNEFISGNPLVMPPVEVEGFGYVTVPRADLMDIKAQTSVSEDAVLENENYRLTFDRDRGGIVSLYDKRLDYEWVDTECEYGFNSFVYEEVADRSHPTPRKLIYGRGTYPPEQVEIPNRWKPGWRAIRRQPTRLVAHQVHQTPLGHRIVQELEAPGCAGSLTQMVFLPNDADYIEIEASWDMGIDTHPSASYILFPFNILNATARYDVGGQPVIVDEEQLPGVCRDYFTVQGWVDFSNQERGVTIALPENPLVQLGDFHFGQYQHQYTLERALLLGWVTNNYWETNFRAHQPGRVHARYRILPYSGTFDEARAHRLGMEAVHNQPLLQHLGEPTAGEDLLPAQGQLLQLPAAPILTLHIKPANDGEGIIIRLLNASNKDSTAEIGSSLLKISRASKCDLLEQPTNDLAVKNGALTVDIPARRVQVLRLNIAKP